MFCQIDDLSQNPFKSHTVSANIQGSSLQLGRFMFCAYIIIIIAITFYIYHLHYHYMQQQQHYDGTLVWPSAASQQLPCLLLKGTNWALPHPPLQKEEEEKKGVKNKHTNKQTKRKHPPTHPDKGVKLTPARHPVQARSVLLSAAHHGL